MSQRYTVPVVDDEDPITHDGNDRLAEFLASRWARYGVVAAGAALALARLAGVAHAYEGGHGGGSSQPAYGAGSDGAAWIDVSDKGGHGGKDANKANDGKKNDGKGAKASNNQGDHDAGKDRKAPEPKKVAPPPQHPSQASSQQHAPQASDQQHPSHASNQPHDSKNDHAAKQDDARGSKSDDKAKPTATGAKSQPKAEGNHTPPPPPQAHSDDKGDASGKAAKQKPDSHPAASVEQAKQADKGDDEHGQAARKDEGNNTQKNERAKVFFAKKVDDIACNEGGGVSKSKVEHDRIFNGPKQPAGDTNAHEAKGDTDTKARETGGGDTGQKAEHAKAVFFDKKVEDIACNEGQGVTKSKAEHEKVVNDTKQPVVGGGEESAVSGSAGDVDVTKVKVEVEKPKIPETAAAPVLGEAGKPAKVDVCHNMDHNPHVITISVNGLNGHLFHHDETDVVDNPTTAANEAERACAPTGTTAPPPTTSGETANNGAQPGGGVPRANQPTVGQPPEGSPNTTQPPAQTTGTSTTLPTIQAGSSPQPTAQTNGTNQPAPQTTGASGIANAPSSPAPVVTSVQPGTLTAPQAAQISQQLGGGIAPNTVQQLTGGEIVALAKAGGANLARIEEVVAGEQAVAPAPEVQTNVVEQTEVVAGEQARAPFSNVASAVMPATGGPAAGIIAMGLAALGGAGLFLRRAARR